MVRADGSLKPSYEALRGLIKGEWWLPPTEDRTDEQGVVEVSGFLGDYRVTVGGASGAVELTVVGRADYTVTVS